ncbi:MAG: hypothetical protein D3909_12260 [Candidatus Electrothrix sp. ATG1]|nr:hypothetical protein [Candidatus Electrothrix sp. ATG1]MCI5210981.1 hypothetical protein [Candidatus Electrothrix sp. ATG2]
MLSQANERYSVMIRGCDFFGIEGTGDREYVVRVKENFSLRDSDTKRKYQKGQLLQGKIAKVGDVRMFICDGYSFGMHRFDKLTETVRSKHVK